ncbi:hypothetical protein [Bergeyella sp. RCAD1439]|uniref:hypothetical protein n=1 Tax=Bergeyella anatis TaxID=3113737 RepID=UPI002E1730F0|nr:hypothetical protein [Bergeyella sp. RCAD1439]
MSIEIREVKSRKDLHTFVYLPEKIHRRHASWIPPLYMDERRFFDKSKNPAFQHNATLLLLAYRDGNPVGRIMGLIPKEYNEAKHQKTARFSYFECNEDREVFNALLSAVERWALAQESTLIVGPMGFSDKEPQGFLTMGFQEKTMMVTNCNFPYMVDFIEESGYAPYVELCQYEVPISEGVPEKYAVYSSRLLERMNFQIHEFTSTRQIQAFVRPVFNLINATYTDIYGFVKISEEEMDDFARRFIPLLNPKLVKIITHGDGERNVVAFVIAMPDLSDAVKKGRGRLWPLGWYHLLRAFKTSKRLVLLLGAVKNEMQGKGLDAILAVKLIDSAKALGFNMMDSHLIMRENTKMRREIERLQGYRLYKEYTIFSKTLV